MKPVIGFFKGLSLFILSILLFASLSLFSLLFIMNQTVMKADFVVSHLDKLDLSALTNQILHERLLEENAQLSDVLVVDIVENTVRELEPWAKEQAKTAIQKGYEYFTGKSASLTLAISLTGVKEALKENAIEAVSKSPPPEFASLSQTEIQLYVNQYANDFLEQYQIPDKLEFDVSKLDAGTKGQIEQARQYISNFSLFYNGLLGATILIILLMFAVSRNIKGTARTLGINLFLFGAIDFVIILLTDKFLPLSSLPLDLPAALQKWIEQLSNDILVPIQTFNLGMVALGVVLIAFSLVYTPRKSVGVEQEA